VLDHHRGGPGRPHVPGRAPPPTALTSPETRNAMTAPPRSSGAEMDELTLMDWRRRTFAIYREVRKASSPEAAHAIWRVRREQLFRDDPSSPLAGDESLRESGLPYWPDDPSLARRAPNRRGDLRQQTVRQHGRGGDHPAATAWSGRASGLG
jgi:hypothetical protein